MLSILALSLMCVLCIGASAHGVADNGHREARQLTVANGLAGNFVQKIVCDFADRMWIATTSGVTIYNGSSMVAVPFVGSEGIMPYVMDICESPCDHAIYAATERGVYVFRPELFAFAQIMDDMPFSRLLCDNGRLYIANAQGFYVYEGGQARQVDVKGDPNVHCMALNPADSSVWMLTSDALCSYVPRDGLLRRRSLRGVFAQGVNFRCMAMVGNMLYVGTKNMGLHVYDIATGQAGTVSGVGNSVSSLYADGQGHVCVATDGTGAYLLNGATAVVESVFNTTAHSGLPLPTNATYYYMRDKHGNDWFGMARHGVLHTYHRYPLFSPYAYGDFTTQGLDVRSFLMDGSVRLIGTHSELYYIDEARGLVRRYTAAQLNGGNIVTCIERFAGKYYIGTYDGGLCTLDTATLDVRPCHQLNSLAPQSAIMALSKKDDNELWVGTEMGIAIIDGHGGVRLMNNTNSQLPDCMVTRIDFTPDGKTWINGSKGLVVMQADGSVMPRNDYPADFFHDEWELCSAHRSDSVLYFARHGVYHTTQSMARHGRIALPEGIILEACHALCFDGGDKLWMATEQGLFRCNPDGTDIMHFGSGEGCASTLVAKHGVTVLGDTLYAATSAGLLCLALPDLAQWGSDSTYRIILHDTYIGDNQLRMPQKYDINVKNRIDLTWNIFSQDFGFKAITNDYAKQLGRLFEWRMDDSEQWAIFRHGDMVRLGSLALGEHQLHIRQAGRPGTATTYAIFVRPSFLAYGELVLLIAAVALTLAWWRYYKNSRIIIQERGEIEEALMESEQLAENLLLQQQDLMDMTQGGKATKYQQIKLSDEECSAIVEQMRHYLETERAYCNPDLKRDDLARRLQVNTTKLSYVFSMYLKMNYYEFINRYRLDEFKRLVAQGACSKYTITALSEQCGFKKSSFFSTFHKVEGMTPTEYLKQNNIKSRL